MLPVLHEGRSRMTAREAEQIRRTKARLRIIQHYQQVTRNVSLTCRFFGISRSKFYFWMTRYRKLGAPGLREYRRGPRVSPHRIPPQLEALILRLREERQYGVTRLSMFLARYHQVYGSPPTIYRVRKAHHVPRVWLKRYRPGPRRRRDIRVGDWPRNGRDGAELAASGPIRLANNQLISPGSVRSPGTDVSPKQIGGLPCQRLARL